ncbi:MAG: hypothetical protein RIB67_09620 [Miltoncostaeaceae bacterium]
MFRDDVDIADLTDLLRALVLPDIWALEALVAGESRLPTGVSHHAGGMTLATATLREDLAYPFTLRGFWERLRDLDERAAAGLEDCGG